MQELGQKIHVQLLVLPKDKGGGLTQLRVGTSEYALCIMQAQCTQLTFMGTVLSACCVCPAQRASANANNVTARPGARPSMCPSCSS